jgi:hypothetical protein
MPIVTTDKATHREMQQPLKAAAELVDIRANAIRVKYYKSTCCREVRYSEVYEAWAIKVSIRSTATKVKSMKPAIAFGGTRTRR